VVSVGVASTPVAAVEDSRLDPLAERPLGSALEQASVAFVHASRVRADTVVPALVHGEDVDDRGRPFVGPDGYIPRADLERAVRALGAVSAALVYAADAPRESRGRHSRPGADPGV
jgi:hypothetical protein